jgi:hypothetical protein
LEDNDIDFDLGTFCDT